MTLQRLVLDYRGGEVVARHVARHWPEAAENPRALERAAREMRRAREFNDPRGYMHRLRAYVQIASHEAQQVRRRRSRRGSLVDVADRELERMVKRRPRHVTKSGMVPSRSTRRTE